MSPEGGKCAAHWEIDAIQLALAGHVDAVVAAPLSIASLHAAQYMSLGVMCLRVFMMVACRFNTPADLRAYYCKAKQTRSMSTATNVRVVYATDALPFKRIFEELGQSRKLIDTIELANSFLV